MIHGRFAACAPAISTETGAPHALQNAVFGASRAPHREQCISSPREPKPLGPGTAISISTVVRVALSCLQCRQPLVSLSRLLRGASAPMFLTVRLESSFNDRVSASAAHNSTDRR